MTSRIQSLASIFKTHMKKLFLILTVSLTFIALTIYGQDTVNKQKYVSLGTKSNGICFGNSLKYNGIRLNLWDKGYGMGASSGKINGMNFSFIISNYLSNGIEFGAIGTYSKICNGIQIGGLAATSDYANGLTIAGIMATANKINGVALSPFAINADTLNGLFIAGFGIAAGDPRTPKKMINGFALAIVAVGAEKVRGVTVSAIWSYSKEHYGLSIACYNKTEILHGLQIGLLNYAGNNPKLVRWLPLINFHR
jgi:hypothetical protein